MDEKDYDMFLKGLKCAVKGIDGVINQLDEVLTTQSVNGMKISLAESRGIVQQLSIELIESHAPNTEDLPF